MTTSSLSDGRLKPDVLHRAIVEKVLGKPLPEGAQIHHVDGNRHNNANSNLVVCPSTSYHWLLHKRQRAYDACGNPNWMMCRLCKKWDDPKNMHVYTPRNRNPTGYMQSTRAAHRKCDAADTMKRRLIKKLRKEES